MERNFGDFKRPDRLASEDVGFVGAAPFAVALTPLQIRCMTQARQVRLALARRERASRLAGRQRDIAGVAHGPREEREATEQMPLLGESA